MFGVFLNSFFDRNNKICKFDNSFFYQEISSTKLIKKYGFTKNQFKKLKKHLRTINLQLKNLKDKKVKLNLRSFTFIFILSNNLKLFYKNFLPILPFFSVSATIP